MDWLDDDLMISEIKVLSKELQARELHIDESNVANVCNTSEPTVKSDYHSEIKNGEKEIEIDGKKYVQKFQRHIQLEKHTVKQIFTFTGDDDSILDIDIDSGTCRNCAETENDVFYNLNRKTVTDDTKLILSPKIVIRSSNTPSPKPEKNELNHRANNCFCKSEDESEIAMFIKKYGCTDLSDLAIDQNISNDFRDSFLSQWQKIESDTKPNAKSKTISCVERFSALSPRGRILHQSTCVQMTRSVLIRSKSIERTNVRKAEKLVIKKEIAKPDIPILFRIDVSKFLVYNDKSNSSTDNTCKYLSIAAGHVDALIAHACSIGINSTDDYPLFHKVFLVTYSLFISIEDLIEKLIMRYKYFCDNSHIVLDDLYDVKSSSDRIQEDLQIAIINVLVGMINYWSRPPQSCVEQTMKSFCEYLNKTGSRKKEMLIQSALRDLQNRILVKQRRTSLIDDSLIIQSNKSHEPGCKSILDFDSTHLAEQITLLESQVFDQVELEDLIKFKSSEKNEVLMNCVHFFNNLTFWIKTQLFLDQDMSGNDREKKVSKLLEILKALKSHQNFSAYTAILYSLIDFPENFLSKRLTQKLAEECQFISLSNKRHYHDAIQSARPPFIPLLAETFSHLTRLNEIMDTFVVDTTDTCPSELSVNFRKIWQHFVVLQYFIVKLHLTPEVKYYQFKPNFDILQFIDNFRNALTENELYQYRENLLKSKYKKQSSDFDSPL